MPATTRIIIASLAICSILVTSTSAYTCYVASSSNENLPPQLQVTMSYNCTACVRGKYVYDKNKSSVFIWGCTTGSTGMVPQSSPGAWTAGSLNNWSAATIRPWSNWGSSWGSWGAVTPSWAVASWAGWSSWSAAAMPWSTWGAPAAGFFNAPGISNSNTCVDGSFDGYSNLLSAYAYMCVCCEDKCNQNLRCKALNGGANTIVAASSSLATLLALTFAVVNTHNY